MEDKAAPRRETGRVAASGQRALKNLNCRQSSLIQGHLTTLMLSQSHHKTEPGEKAHELAWVKIAGIQMCVCTCVYAFVCYVDVHPAKSRREWADAWLNPSDFCSGECMHTYASYRYAKTCTTLFKHSLKTVCHF